MDTVVAMRMAVAGEPQPSASREYKGDYYPVRGFMDVLYGEGPDITIVDRDNVERMTRSSLDNFEGFQRQWVDWKVGFSHFLQLSKEPTTQTHWKMVSRRAAGVFPRNFKGVDLIIPIVRFSSTRAVEVSMILAHVKNRADADAGYPGSACEKMWPSRVFKSDLRDRTARRVLRIYMSLREQRKPRRFYLLGDDQGGPNVVGEHDQGEVGGPSIGHAEHRSAQETPSYTMCMRGLAESCVRSHEQLVFLSNVVVLELKKILEPRWDPMVMVQVDESLLKVQASTETGETHRITKRKHDGDGSPRKRTDPTQAV